VRAPPASELKDTSWESASFPQSGLLITTIDGRAGTRPNPFGQQRSLCRHSAPQSKQPGDAAIMKPTSKFSLIYRSENELGWTTSESADNTPSASPRQPTAMPRGKRPPASVQQEQQRMQLMRQLPCRMHLSSGSCSSYGNSCVFPPLLAQIES